MGGDNNSVKPTEANVLEPRDARSDGGPSKDSVLGERISMQTALNGKLPLELVREVSSRLAMAALVFAVAFFLAWTAAPREWQPSGTFPVLDVTMGVAVLASVLILYLSRALRARAQLLSDIGLVYAVFCCLLIAITESWMPWPEDQVVRGISWICLVLITFPLTVPAPPKKTLVASFLGASMVPVGLLIGALRGNPWPTFQVTMALILPAYLSASVVFVLARIVFRLGHDASARQVGSYQLEKLLGQGGMGEVWQGKHQLLFRPAAVKLIRPDVLTVGEDRYTIFRRFEREAAVIASLSSPNTVELFDFGVSKDGAFYYVMELLDGLDLETIVGRFGPQPAERVIHILRQVGLSLAEAHNAGLVHRDIKPANIYVCRLGVVYDCVKVLDFGLVITEESAEQKFTRLTNEGLTTGTPAYMAPEMAANTEIDARSDIYGLGCVAYFALTGQLVFPSSSPMRVLADHLQTQPKPPSQRTELPVPEDLEQVILSCLEKNPDHRPQTALDLVAQLDACESANWTLDHASRWWRVNAPEKKK